MIIELQEPFASKWSKGYIVVNNQNRRNVVLFNNQSDRTTISYARYLMGVKLGYEVPDHLEVDHKDDDKTNDDINNLQLLTKEENLLKEQYRYIMFEQVRYGYYCAYCTDSFILTEAEVNERLAKNVEMAFCSRSCSTNFHRYISKTNKIGITINENEIQQIKQLRSKGLSSYKISEITGFARNTVMKYW
jgi:hypothetical protein